LAGCPVAKTVHFGALKKQRKSFNHAVPNIAPALPVVVGGLVSILGVDFDAAWERRVETVIDPASGLKANFISAEDLIPSKLTSGRPQGLADADAVRKAAESQRPGAKKRPEPSGPNQ
jgi:hypothetical protein